MGTYQPATSKNHELMKAAVSPLANVKSLPARRIDSRCVDGARGKGKSCRCVNDVCVAAAFAPA